MRLPSRRTLENRQNNLGSHAGLAPVGIVEDHDEGNDKADRRHMDDDQMYAELLRFMPSAHEARGDDEQ